MRDPLLDDLDTEQRRAVTSPCTPLAIIAPAGSGKTRVLTRRIAYRVREGVADARHVLALTFTRKAAGELVERLAVLAGDRTITAGTFHAIALAQLRRHAADRGQEAPRILDRKARLLAPLVGGRGPSAAIAINDAAAEIEWAKARLVAPAAFAAAAGAAHRRLTRPAAEIGEVYARYEREKQKRRLLDFDDVLSRCAEHIGRDEEFAAGQRWRFRHFFVDEFQDTTPLQLQLLTAWLGGRDDLSVVGDPAQAIYGFAGADASPLVQFHRTFPAGETVALVRNYRSTPAIVALAESALGSVAAREPPTAARSDSAQPTIVAYDTDEAEAAGVADACWHAFVGGVSWPQMAVLFRTNAQSSLFEAALHRRGVPFRVAAGERFAMRPPVRLLLDRLREVERTAPGRRLADHFADLAADDDDALASPDVVGHRDALLELGREFLAVDGSVGSVAAFVGWLDTVTRGDPRDGTGVDLLTFHRAKGLEWPVVFVTGLERGFVPVPWATSQAAVAEERRLLHVALGRAEHELHCSWARGRTVGGRRSAREPSPWLVVLEQAVRGLSARDRDSRGHLAELRDALAAVSPPPPRPRPGHRRIR